MKVLGYYLAAIALFVAASPAAAQWTRVDAVPTGFVIAVRSFGDTIVAGTTTLAYISTDAGASWHPSQPARIVVPIESMVMRNGTLYLGTTGEHTIAWDLRDEAGHAVGAGLYFARLEVEGRALTQKLVTMK